MTGHLITALEELPQISTQRGGREVERARSRPICAACVDLAALSPAMRFWAICVGTQFRARRRASSLAFSAAPAVACPGAQPSHLVTVCAVLSAAPVRGRRRRVVGGLVVLLPSGRRGGGDRA